MSDDDKIPYFKVNKLLWRWKRIDGAEGCTVVREARLSMDKGLAVLAVTFAMLFVATHTDNRSASECIKSTSKNGRYIAERCLLQWRGGNDPDYRGQVYDAASGKLLVRRTFSTPVPELIWLDDEGVSFSRGGDDASFIKLPPSFYDRMIAKFIRAAGASHLDDAQRRQHHFLKPSTDPPSTHSTATSHPATSSHFQSPPPATPPD
jgi:hypothetical protein